MRAAVLTLTLLALAGCGGGGAEEERLRTSPVGLAGEYVGTWSREDHPALPADSGDVRITVDLEGHFRGTGTSARYGPDREVIGGLQPGAYIDFGMITHQNPPGEPFFDGFGFKGPMQVKGRKLVGDFMVVREEAQIPIHLELRKL